MNPLAVYNAMYYDQRIEGTTMIIDLGAENTDLIIADGDTIWLRSIPIGGNNFTEALVKSFKLNFAKAEELKRNAATSKYARQIFQAMRPVFADLVAEIQRSIGFYASVHRDSRISRIARAGRDVPAARACRSTSSRTCSSTSSGSTRSAPARRPTPKLAATFNDNLLSVVSAYGLALQAMGEGEDHQLAAAAAHPPRADVAGEDQVVRARRRRCSCSGRASPFAQHLHRPGGVGSAGRQPQRASRGCSSRRRRWTSSGTRSPARAARIASGS